VIRRAPIALALALAAVAVPTAHADAISRYLANHPHASSTATRPDDRAGSRYVVTTPAIPDAIDRYLANHPNGTPSRPDDRSGVRPVPVATATPAHVSSSPPSFAWRDAAIGGAATLGALLALSAAVAGARRLRPAL
jgi:hypothetical protein